MNASLNFKRLVCLGAAVVFCTVFVLPARAADTNEPAKDTSSNDTLRSYLQLQEQLHATQLALDHNRQEAEAIAARNSEEVAARFKAIESALTTQRLAELDTMQRTLQGNNRLLLTVAGAIASIGFLVLLLTAYLQWRSVNRLAEFSAMVQNARLALPSASPVEAQLLGAGDTVQSGQRLSSALTHLEKRIFELEHTAHGTTGGKVIAPVEATHTNGVVSENGANGEHPPTGHDAVLLAKGQSLLNLDKAAEALECFEELLRADPNHAEALVKKGIALEELRQMDEALQCYDRAIAANGDLTIAYLQKGGLFNRLERYEEALQCYEQALHAQEKAHAA